MAPETPRLSIDRVIHEALPGIDEAGVEAAAATAVVFGARTGSNVPVYIHADRPFLVLIRHDPTGTILFIGRVVQP